MKIKKKLWGGGGVVGSGEGWGGGVRLDVNEELKFLSSFRGRVGGGSGWM